MCLAIFKPMKTNFPKIEIMREAWSNNPHGAGLAIVTDDGVKILKGIMTFENLMEIIESLDLVDFEVLLHFRWATSGPDNKPATMTHPFPITKDNTLLKTTELICERALIHNGVMFSPQFSDYSDTAIFARYLSYFPNATEKEIADSIPAGNKVAIATKNGVQLFGHWTVVNGIHYSNLFSMPYERTWKNAKAKTWNKKSRYEIDYDNMENASKHNENDYALYSARRDDPYYFNDGENYLNESENDYVDYSSDDLDYCPHCDSDNTEMIGVRQNVAECLDCGAVYNETEFIIAPEHVSAKIQTIKTKVKAG